MPFGRLKYVVLGNHNLNMAEKTGIEQMYKPKTYENVGKGADIMLLKVSKYSLVALYVFVVIYILLIMLKSVRLSFLNTILIPSKITRNCIQ